jgi:hypothetical protein
VQDMLKATQVKKVTKLHEGISYLVISIKLKQGTIVRNNSWGKLKKLKTLSFASFPKIPLFDCCFGNINRAFFLGGEEPSWFCNSRKYGPF